jgi:hypothetical protein
MPLVRFEVRNELRLGQGELCREANREEDPKAVLDAVAAAALVGILRQLGDLAEFVPFFFFFMFSCCFLFSKRYLSNMFLKQVTVLLNSTKQ